MRKRYPGPVHLLTALLLAAAAAPSGAEAQQPAIVSAPGATATAPQPAVVSAPAASAAEPQPGRPGEIAAGERLAIDRCIEIALQRNPALQAAAGSANAARSRVGQARSAYFPQVTLSGGYSKFTLPTDPTNARVDQYTENATVTQNLFDFGRTWNQVTAAQKNAAAAGEDLRTTRAVVILNVKQAYYSLLRAEKNRDVLKETVGSFEKHLEQARGFFEAGVKSKFDVTKAEVDLSNARLNLIRAENALRIARVTLNNAMGMPDAPDYTIEDTLAFQKVAIAFEEARDRALANRPDLRSNDARRQASEAALSLARSNYLPFITGSASYTRTDRDFPPEPDGWSAGVTVMLPLFSGFLTNSQVREAKENLAAARANVEALRQNVLLDVQQSWSNLQEAEERVAVAELTVKQAEENFAIAKGRYDAGVGSPIEETDALLALSNAKTSFIAALADYRVAEATLLKAMGE